MNTQDTQVAEYLSQIGVSFEAVYTGETKRDDWACDAWIAKFNRAKKTERFDYYTGLGLRSKPKNRFMHQTVKPQAPTAASVLYSLLLDAGAADEGFNDWCANFGYDVDSRKALDTYLACQANANRLAGVLTFSERSKLSELLQDY